MRVFDNTHQLHHDTIERRLRMLDAEANASTYRVEREDHTWRYYVGVESTLEDAQVEACLVPMMQEDTDAEVTERARQEWLKTAQGEVNALKVQKADKAAMDAKLAELDAKLKLLEEKAKGL